MVRAKTGNHIRETGSDRVINAAVLVLLAVLFVIWFFPMLYVVLASVTPYEDVVRAGLLILPSRPTFTAYSFLFSSTGIVGSFLVTLTVTVVGTLLSMALSILLAFPLSKKGLPGRALITKLLVFTMYFSGGLIPTYMMVRRLHLLNTIWALIIPGCVSTYNMLLLRSYFVSMPDELLEAAEVDGCRPLRTLVQIALPLSLPVTMSVMLFYMVAYWNTYYAYYYYCYDKALRPLQVVLMDLIRSATGEAEADEFVPTITVQMAAVVFSCVPIVCVYPFIQKYFTTGIMLGAVKG